MTKGRKPKERQRAFLRGDKEKEIVRFILENADLAREPLAEKMIAEIDWGVKAPEPEVLWKKISKYRNREPNPQDQPWHMGSLDRYPHSAEGVAAIMVAYRFAVQHEGSITIRQAKWIARLCEVPSRMFPAGPSDEELATLLIIWACEYANWELWCEVAGEENFNTTNIDYRIATRVVAPVDQWETVAEVLVKSSAHAPRELREWASEPEGKDSIRRQKEMREIVRRVEDNPDLAGDKELWARFDSLKEGK